MWHHYFQLYHAHLTIALDVYCLLLAGLTLHSIWRTFCVAIRCVFMPLILAFCLLHSHCCSSLQGPMSCMQGGGEKLTDEAIEDTLEKVVKLLAYISDKDLFAEFYRKKLARRLLQERSSSDEHERSILSRLKQQCGAQFTSKVTVIPADVTHGSAHCCCAEPQHHGHCLVKPMVMCLGIADW